jgi:sensor histidine kinase YesM
MHPILSSRYTLTVYLAAWLPLALILWLLLVTQGSLTTAAAAALALPLALLYAFVCLGAWYVCRAAPLDASSATQLVATHAIAGALSSALWVAVGSALAFALDAIGWFGSVSSLYASLRPLMFSVGLLAFLLAVAGNYLVVAFERSQAAETRALRLQVMAREAELRALRAQIDPHFLFNSLHSISALATVDGQRARQMCLLLGDFLRSSLKAGGKQSVTLEEELAVVRQYLAIEQVRFGQRLTVADNLDPEAASCQVPPLLLQPLAENAVKHGVAQMIEGGRIEIHARRSGGRVMVEIANPTESQQGPARGAGVGLANVRARLSAWYGNDADLKVQTTSQRFAALVTVPFKESA